MDRNRLITVRKRIRPERGLAMAAHPDLGSKIRSSKAKNCCYNNSREARKSENNHGKRGVFAMRAMILDAPGRPLRLAEVPVPEPGRGQVLIQGSCLRNLPHRPAHPGR